MTRFSRRAKAITAVILAVPAVIVVAYAIYLASIAGKLPWQADPTRISESLTPFANIPGFSFPTVVPAARNSPVATPAPGS